MSWWFTAPVPASAPSNDLILINKLIQYRQIDKDLADAALLAFSRHLWFLTEELVVLGLFCKDVNDASIQLGGTNDANSSSRICENSPFAQVENIQLLQKICVKLGHESQSVLRLS